MASSERRRLWLLAMTATISIAASVGSLARWYQAEHKHAPRSPAPQTSPANLKLQPAVVLEGEIVDDLGHPVAAAEVEARPEAVGARTLSTRSDERGLFRFADAAEGIYALQARAEHHDLAVMPDVRAPSTEPVRIVVQRASSLRGEVIGSDGKAAVGARVTIAGSGIWPPKSVQTDALGHFELTKVQGGVYELRATLGTFTSEPREGLLLAPASEIFVSLHLEPGATLRGRVVDAQSGQPLTGVSVLVAEDGLVSAPVRIVTKSDGQFAAEGLRNVPHRVWIQPQGYVAVAGETRTPGAAMADYALSKAAVLAGIVVDEQGAPVSGAALDVQGTNERGESIVVSPPVSESDASSPPPTVTARVPSTDNLGVTLGAVPKVPVIALPTVVGSSAPALGFRTDGRGRFRIEGIPAGTAQIVARRSGFAAGRSVPRVLRAGEQVDDLRVLLPRGGKLLGRVVDARGLPVSGARVQLDVQGDPSPRVTLSAEDGGFELDALRGACTLTAYPVDGPPVREQVELSSGQTREVVLQLAGESRTLPGRVHDARGFPVARARISVEARSTRSPTLRTATSAADGTFRVSGLPGPPYRVRVEHPDYASSETDLVSLEKQEEISIEIRRGARVFGLVVDGMSNNGVAGARARLTSGTASSERTARSSTQGRFEFRNVSDGNYELFVDHEGHIAGHTKVTVAGAESREVDPIALQPAGQVSGQVVDRLGAPVFDAEVATGSPPTWGQAVRTDHLGRFRIVGVRPGESWVNARHAVAGASPEPVPVRVYPRQESPGLVVRLQGGPR
jgi:protocatechuate 3,4-dioxygenase beta subunit